MSVTGTGRNWERFSMQLVTRGDWRACEATRNAAAICALGVPVAPLKTYKVKERIEVVTFLHEPGSVRPHWKHLGGVKEIMRRWKHSELDPQHPFVDARRAIHNAEHLQQWVHSQVPLRLVYEPGRRRTRLQEGQVLQMPSPYARVMSLAKAAALATLGFPVLAVEDAGDGHMRFVLPRLSVPVQDEGQPRIHDAADLLAGERDNTLPPTHPFMLACLAAQAWLELLSACEAEQPALMFQGRNIRAAAFVHSAADKDVIDRSERFAARA
jgi:hypothetical protein